MKYTIAKITKRWNDRRPRYEVRADRIDDENPGDCLGVFQTLDEAETFIEQLTDNKIKYESANKSKP